MNNNPIFVKIVQIIILSCASCWLLACGGGTDGNKLLGDDSANNIIVIGDQTVVDLKKITLSNVTLEQNVCVAIYEAVAGNASSMSNKVIGDKTLTAGQYNNEIIELDREILDGEMLFAQMHEGSCKGDDGVIETSSVVISQNSVAAVGFKIERSTVPYVQAENQEAANLYQIDVEKVIAESSAWLVAHYFDSQAADNLGGIAGYQLVDSGHSSDVSIFLNYGLEDGDEIVIALYENAFVTADEDFNDAEDILVSNSISETLSIKVSPIFGKSACDDCIHFSIKSLGYNAYEWSGDATARKKILTQSGSLGDETIRFSVGDRVEIINPETFLHPFALYGDNNTVLLSQASNSVGSFEDDVDVNWTNVNGIMTFTVTQELADVLTRYLCTSHRVMTGSIEISN